MDHFKYHMSTAMAAVSDSSRAAVSSSSAAGRAAVGGSSSSGAAGRAAVSSSSAATSSCGIRRCSVPLRQLPSPSVRRRPPSPNSTPVKTEPPSPERSPPRPPEPSEATVRTVMRLQDSVACVVRRRRQRPPVYAALRLPLARSQSEEPVECPRLGADFHSLLRGGRGRPAPLTEEQRGKLLYAVTSLETALNAAAHPPAEVLRCLLRHSAEGDDLVRRRCLRLLRQVIFLHPPHGRRLRRLYHAVLAGPDPKSPDWSAVWSAVQRCLPSQENTTSAEDEEHVLNTELLDVLVGLLEDDLSFWWRFAGRGRSSGAQLDSPGCWPLLVAALWRPGQQPGSSVAAGRRLAAWLAQAHRRRPGAAGGDMTTRRLLLRLMAMSAEVCRVREQGSIIAVSDDMQTMAGDLSRAVQEEHLSADRVQDLLCSLRPAWLAARLAAGRLHLLHGREPLTGPLTLRLIHGGYLSEKENRSPPPSVAAAAAAMTAEPGPNAGPVAPRKRSWRSPVGSPAKRGRSSSDPEDVPGGRREYSLLVYQLLCSHLLHTGLTEVRLRMTRLLLRDDRPAPAPTTAPAAASPEELLSYRRELEWLQDRLWRREAAVQLDGQFESYMRAITKL